MHLHPEQRRRTPAASRPAAALRRRSTHLAIRLRQAAIIAGIVLIAVVLTRLLQLHLTGLHLQAALGSRTDQFISAELSWGRSEAERLTHLVVGLALTLGGILVLRPGPSR